MVTLDTLDPIFAREQTGAPVLSLFLNVDQSNASNLNHGYRVGFKNAARALQSEHPEDEALVKCLDAVREFLDSYSPEGKSLALMCDADQGIFWKRTLSVPLQTSGHWRSTPYIRPLVEARDEFQRYGVILTDRRHARLFTVILNAIEEHQDLLAESKVAHFDATGRDTRMSQMNFQRAADEHVRQHLHNVAAMMDELAGKRVFDRLILAGPTEAVSELEKQLSEPLRERLIGRVSLPVEAQEKDILEKTREFAIAFERDFEDGLVGKLITTAAKDSDGVTGLNDTADMALQGRVATLVYAEGFEPSETAANAIRQKAQEQAEAGVQSGAQTCDDPLEWVMERVLLNGGAVEQVRDEAAARLQEAGGVGAFLRF